MIIPSTNEMCLLTSVKSQALLFLLAISASAQKIATLGVNLDKPTAGLQVPVHVMLAILCETTGSHHFKELGALPR